ncbi:MAG TPA: hypothetical protein VKR58_06305 [Aquella sp.]|nr:hypothetical protein [Aquella sp.]
MITNEQLDKILEDWDNCGGTIPVSTIRDIFVNLRNRIRDLEQHQLSGWEVRKMIDRGPTKYGASITTAKSNFLAEEIDWSITTGKSSIEDREDYV